MLHVRYLSLQLLLLCCCNIQVSSNEHASVHKVQARRSLRNATYKIVVNVTSNKHECDARFLSISLGSGHIIFHLDSSEKLRSLAVALSPADFRVGGTAANFLTFDPESKFSSVDSFVDSSAIKPMSNYTVSGEQWDSFNTFIANVGWDLLFDVNVFKWKSDGAWDLSNVELLLNYSSAKGFRIPYFQLGNEPNSYWRSFSFNITPETMVRNYQVFKKLISRYPLYAASKLYGPDVTNVARSHSAREYLQKFIAAGGHQVVDEISFHHYYLDGTLATAKDFLSVSTLDSLKNAFEVAFNITKASPRPLPIRLTETSSSFGGGSPGLSNAYIAGFLWLDKLGLAAQYGITRVFRQTFYGSSYGLIQYNFIPNPDYYLSVLYKRLVEGPVFNLNLDPPNPKIRVYAHCAAQKGIYSPGALVVYYLNLEEFDSVLSLTQFVDADLDLYLLTPGNEKGLTSSFVKLNGKTLLMTGSELPPLLPERRKGNVTIEAQSFGFIVVPCAEVSLCVKYFERKKEESQNASTEPTTSISNNSVVWTRRSHWDCLYYFCLEILLIISLLINMDLRVTDNAQSKYLNTFCT